MLVSWSVWLSDPISTLASPISHQARILRSIDRALCMQSLMGVQRNQVKTSGGWRQLIDDTVWTSCGIVLKNTLILYQFLPGTNGDRLDSIRLWLWHVSCFLEQCHVTKPFEGHWRPSLRSLILEKQSLANCCQPQGTEVLSLFLHIFWPDYIWDWRKDARDVKTPDGLNGLNFMRSFSIRSTASKQRDVY